MSISHSAAIRGTLAQTILTAIDQGSTYGKIKIYTSGDSLLATIILPDPSMSRSGAVLTLLGVPLSATASGTGTAAKFSITDSDDNVIYQGSIGTSGADLTIDNTSINSGQTVRVTAHTYTTTT
jgi:hypothetical protein